MIEMTAVVSPSWDVHVPLSGRMSREDVFAALAAIAEYGKDEDYSPEMLPAVLEEELIIMAGGLRVRDTVTGVEIEHGCCMGLEDWRAWQELLDGRAPWLGHSSEPGVEFADGVVRLWQDGARRDGPACEIRTADLPGLLEGVRQDLIGFLDLVRKWAPNGLGERLAARFDEDFQISAPL
ncbi:hypothetical protein LFM09_05620 [Lentzea alba]|uniref:hypothetical protein n=1 Tax=Lentzea alba TaxID=2714351 RepID=UPI0039BF1AF8